MFGIFRKQIRDLNEAAPSLSPKAKGYLRVDIPITSEHEIIALMQQADCTLTLSKDMNWYMYFPRGGYSLHVPAIHVATVADIVLRNHDRKHHGSAKAPPVAARQFIAAGYRRTSNRHRIVSRIDRPDWVEVLAKHLGRSPAELYEIGADKPAATWCDFYRRVLSKDKVDGVPEDIFKLIPASGHDSCGYVE